MSSARQTRIRRGCAALSLVIGLLAAAACGGPAPSGSGDDAAASGTIRMVTPIFEGADGQPALNNLLASFKKENPKVDVEIDYTSYSKLNDKLNASLASGRPYDVMLMGVGWVPPFAAKGLLADLGTSPAELLKTYNKRVIDPGVWQDKVYAMPIILDTRFGIYRKDLFAQAGLTGPPKNFAELRQYATKLTRRDGSGKLTRAGVDILSNDLRQTFLPLMWANGGELFTPDGKVAFNSDKSVAALQLMTDIVRTDKSEDFGYAKPGDLVAPLVQGRAAMMIGHNNLWLQIQRTNPDLIKNDQLGTFLLANERPAMFQGGTLAAASAKSKHLAAAKALVRFLASEQSSLVASQQRGNIPAVTSLAGSDYVKKDTFVQFAMANLDAAYSEGGVPAWLEIRGEFKAALEAALLGQKTPKQALDDLAAEATRAMSR